MRSRSKKARRRVTAQTSPRDHHDDAAADAHAVALDLRDERARAAHLDALRDLDARRHAARGEVGAQRPGGRAGGRVLPALDELREHARPRAARAVVARRGTGSRRSQLASRCSTRSKSGSGARDRVASRRTGAISVGKPGRDDLRRAARGGRRRAPGRPPPSRGCGSTSSPNVAGSWSIEAVHASPSRRTSIGCRPAPVCCTYGASSLAARRGHRDGRPERRMPGEGHLPGHGQDAVAVVGAVRAWRSARSVVSDKPRLARERAASSRRRPRRRRGRPRAGCRPAAGR